MEDIQFKKNYSAFVNPNYAVTPTQKKQPSGEVQKKRQ